MGQQSVAEKSKTHQTAIVQVQQDGKPVGLLGQSEIYNFTGGLTATVNRNKLTVVGEGGSSTPYGVASGTSTYAVTLGLSSYTTGQMVSVNFPNANTGASTLNADGLGAKAIQLNGIALTAGQIPAKSTLDLIYDGTNFQIIGLTSVGPTGPAHQFEWVLSTQVQSTKADASNKLSAGRRFIDPTDPSWGTSGTSTITCNVELETTNAAIAVGADLFQLTGTGAPQLIATLPTTTSVTPTNVSVNVSSAFRPTGVAGDYVIRAWITTANGNDYVTINNATLKVTP